MGSLCAQSNAQRARFPDFFTSQGSSIPAPANTIPALPAIPGLPGTQNPSIITTPNFAPLGVPQTRVFPPQNLIPNLPSFNPAQAPNQPFPIFPRATQPPPVQIFQQPQVQPPLIPQQFTQPIPQQFTQPQFNQPQFGTAPSTNQWTQQAWASFRNDFLPRFLERPRVRQTYLAGGDGNEVEINDIEIATTATFPNFFGGRTPLRVSPGFIFHFWDGPDSVATPGFDLPARAYSGYLAFDHITDPSRIGGLETNFTVGFYSDFDNTSSDGIRLTSRVVGWRRINSYTVGKLGIEYFDRVDVKLLPAVGLYMTPNPDLKLDLFFPRTKLSHRIPNIGNFETWAYVGGEYGGGSWAIERANGDSDQVDINDVRAFLGLEWLGPRRVTGFAEFGYVFEREILYRSDPSSILDIPDTLMFRSGIAF